jgi:SAM-dependent methyltransferase
MARLGSQAKAGFYPTPEKVCGQLKQLLDIEQDARLLDPCCGKGKTLDFLAEDTAGESFGIELDHQRATEARGRLPHVLWGDSLVEIRISPASFGLLYLNPPYDYAMAPDGKAERLEVQFLKRYQNVLQKDGWLVLVIPYTILRFCAAVLARHFEMLQVFAFPEEEFQVFKQCVVLGRKRQLVAKDQASKTERSLVRLAGYVPDEFLATIPELAKCAFPMTIPAPTGLLNTFKSTRIDPLEAVPLVRKCGLLVDVLHDLTPRQCNSIRPLAPLENGHLALLLAGGYMNGEIELDGKRLVIKGVVSKSEKVQSVSENAAGDTTVVTRDQYLPTVRAIDMVRAEMMTIQ